MLNYSFRFWLSWKIKSKEFSRDIKKKKLNKKIRKARKIRKFKIRWKYPRKYKRKWHFWWRKTKLSKPNDFQEQNPKGTYSHTETKQLKKSDSKTKTIRKENYSKDKKKKKRKNNCIGPYNAKIRIFILFFCPLSNSNLY